MTARGSMVGISSFCHSERREDSLLFASANQTSERFLASLGIVKCLRIAMTLT